MRISASRSTSKHFTRNETRNERDLVTREISQRDARRPHRCPSLCAHRDTPVISNVLSRGVMLFGTGTEFGSRARVHMTMCAQRRRDGSDVFKCVGFDVARDVVVVRAPCAYCLHIGKRDRETEQTHPPRKHPTVKHPSIHATTTTTTTTGGRGTPRTHARTMSARSALLALSKRSTAFAPMTAHAVGFKAYSTGTSSYASSYASYATRRARVRVAMDVDRRAMTTTSI